MNPIKVFFIEPTGTVDRRLRRYSSSASSIRPKCPKSGHDYCNAEVFLDIVPAEGQAKGDSWPHADPRWPKACECGYEFVPADNWQLFTEPLYRRLDSKEEFRLRDAPAGAMWYADWNIKFWPEQVGPDGHVLMVNCPNGDKETRTWNVDSQASNCTRKDDKKHRCWCRHGDPQTGIITVDKNGDTCAAGAGSIALPNWHGVLRDGYLVTC